MMVGCPTMPMLMPGRIGIMPGWPWGPIEDTTVPCMSPGIEVMGAMEVWPPRAESLILWLGI